MTETRPSPQLPEEARAMVEALFTLEHRLHDRSVRFEHSVAAGTTNAEVFPSIRTIALMATELAEAATRTAERLEVRLAVVRNAAGRQASFDLTPDDPLKAEALK